MTDCGSCVKQMWATPYFLLKRTLLEVPDWVLYVLMESSSPAVTRRSSLLWKSRELMRAALSYKVGTSYNIISRMSIRSNVDLIWTRSRPMVEYNVITIRHTHTLKTRPTPKNLTTSSLICMNLLFWMLDHPSLTENLTFKVLVTNGVSCQFLRTRRQRQNYSLSRL